MKKIIFLIALCFLYFHLTFAQSGWSWQNPLPQGNSLTSVKIVNSNTVYAIGYSGTVMKSTDLGNSWSYQMINPLYHYLSVFFIDANTGFASGYYYESFIPIPKGLISRTTNGGLTWNNFLSPNISNMINSVYFINSNTGFAVDSWGNILRTTNNGNNWNTIYTAPNNSLNAIQFLSSNVGFASGGHGIMLKTVNSGLNWYQISFVDTNTITTLNFIDSLNGFCSAPQANYYKTTNGGLNWQNKGGADYMTSIFFQNMNTGFIFGGSPWYYDLTFIFKTINGGNNWFYPHTDSGTIINSIHSVDNNNYVAVGNGGTIFKSSDQGNSWSFKTQGFVQQFSAVYFLNSNIGFAGGYDEIAGVFYGVILRTTNSGLNWTKNFDSTQWVWTFCFLNSSTGFAAGGAYAMIGHISKTTNGGENWVLQNYYGLSIRDMMFADISTGYAVCRLYNILKTTNSGDNWNNNFVASVYLNSLFCLNSNLVYVVGDSGTVYKTTNGGINWNILQTGTWQNLNSIYFLNNSTGYIAADSGTVLKTTNEGINWTKTLLGPVALKRIRFIDANTGFICGEKGTILKTTNGGQNWYIQISPTTNDLNSSFFINSTTGYVVGQYGTIIKTTTGGDPIGIKPISNSVPDKFALFQNYPNPFNPNSKIKYQIAKWVDVRLIVYDALGRKVATLVNENQTHGTYEKEWDGSNMASGVYFYQLKAGDFKQTRKMVLIK